MSPILQVLDFYHRIYPHAARWSLPGPGGEAGDGMERLLRIYRRAGRVAAGRPNEGDEEVDDGGSEGVEGSEEFEEEDDDDDDDEEEEEEDEDEDEEEEEDEEEDATTESGDDSAEVDDFFDADDVAAAAARLQVRLYLAPIKPISSPDEAPI